MIQRRTLPIAVAATSAILLALTGCSGGGSSAAPSGDADVRVGYFPLAHTATVVHADEDGLFDDEGMSVELTQTAGGAAAITALTSGSLDIIYSNYTSAIIAGSKGLSVRIIAANDLGGSDHGIYVAPDSAIESAEDIAGTRFAVNNLQNIGTLAVYSMLDANGLDATDVELVEMPYPDMQAAVSSGQVDAIWQVEPFQASAEAAGLVKVDDMFTGELEDVPLAGWLTTQEYADANPEKIAAFQAAISASAAALQDDRERLVELVPEFANVPAAVVESMELPLFATELDIAGLTLTTDLLEEYGILAEEFDVESMIIGEGDAP